MHYEPFESRCDFCSRAFRKPTVAAAHRRPLGQIGSPDPSEPETAVFDNNKTTIHLSAGPRGKITRQKIPPARNIEMASRQGTKAGSDGGRSITLNTATIDPTTTRYDLLDRNRNDPTGPFDPRVETESFQDETTLGSDTLTSNSEPEKTITIYANSLRFSNVI